MKGFILGAYSLWILTWVALHEASHKGDTGK